MSEVKIVVEILREVGLPALIIVVLLYLCLKTVPDLIKAWQKSRVDQQEHNNDRQRHYDNQMEILFKIAEQGNNVIARSNEVIAHNTEAIKKNTAVHDKVIGALSRDLKALEDLGDAITKHDDRAHNIQIDLARMSERM